MGLSSTTNRVSYVGDGSSTVFSFPYEFFSTSDLQVFIYDAGSSIIYPQTLNTNYTISGGQNVNGIFPNGGNVVYASAVPTSFQTIITRAPSPVQNFVLLQNGQINSLALVQQFDYLTALVQRLQDQVSRSITMPDGLGSVNGVTFSSGLPSSINLASSAFQVLTVNSGATGWQLSVVPGVGSLIPVSQGGTGQGSPLIPGGVMYAATSSQITVSAQGTVGQALLSGAGGAPSWGSISIGSGAVTAGSIQGILGLYQGGTNTGSSYSYPVNSVIVASGTAANQQFVGALPTLPGLPIVAQGSSIPAFAALPLNGPGLSGILPATSGGTGASIITNPGGVIVGSGLTSFASTAAGGVDLPLVGNGFGPQPSFRALNLSSGSTVTGALSIISGGTGQTTAAAAFQALSPTSTWGDIIYAGSGNIATKLSAGSSGLFLQTFGPNANPQWVATASGSSLVNPMTTSGDSIYGGAAGLATRLPGSTSNSTAVLVQTGSGGFSAAPVWRTFTNPIEQIFTAVGSTTFAVSSSALYLEVYAVGGGGGGGGSGFSNTGGGGGNGGVTMFGSSLVICNGGIGAQASGVGGAAGGAGGSSSVFAAAFGETIGGGEGMGNTFNSALAVYQPGAYGGLSPYFASYGPGGPANAAGRNAPSNGGGGGGGGGSTNIASNANGCGGGSGGFAHVFVPAPLNTTYQVIVGVGGTAGTAGSSGFNGGNGGSGKVVVITHFQ